MGQGFRTAYLTTHDQQIFYSRCGYKFSESVCAFGGSSSLNLGNFAKTSSAPSVPLKPPTANGLSNTGGPSPPAPPAPPAPPPPPPPKMLNSPSQTATVSSISPDLVSVCAKAFAQPSLPPFLPLIENIPEIDMNLRNKKNKPFLPATILAHAQLSTLLSCSSPLTYFDCQSSLHFIPLFAAGS